MADITEEEKTAFVDAFFGGFVDAELHRRGVPDWMGAHPTKILAVKANLHEPAKQLFERPTGSVSDGIVQVVDGFDFRLPTLTRAGAERARITLTHLAEKLGYSDKAQLKLLAQRHAQEIAEFGETFTVKVYGNGGLNRVRQYDELTFNPDQAAYLALSSETEQGRACRVRMLDG